MNDFNFFDFSFNVIVSIEKKYKKKDSTLRKEFYLI